jgi:hypothetical protein
MQQHFVQIMRAGNAEADPEEIDWPTIVGNWDLPFPTRIKRSATNPMNEEDLEREKHRFYRHRPCYETMGDRAHTDLVIRSFAELNDIEPGLGDQLRDAIRGTMKPSGTLIPPLPKEPIPPPRQLRLL